MLVGHNIAAFDLTVLLSRMQHHKVGRGSSAQFLCGLSIAATFHQIVTQVTLVDPS